MWPEPIRARGRVSAAIIIIPAPFDPRLISIIPPAVAQAAMDTGVARKPIIDMEAYRAELSARRDPVAGVMQTHHRPRCSRNPKRVVFAEGEEEQVIRAATTFVRPGPRHGDPGRPRGTGRANVAAESGIELDGELIEIITRAFRTRNSTYAQTALRAAAAQGLPAARLPAPDQPGPQSFCRLHGRAPATPTRWSPASRAISRSRSKKSSA